MQHITAKPKKGFAMIRMFIAVLWTAFSLSAVVSLWGEMVAPMGYQALIVLFPVAGVLFARDAWERLYA
ncbi:MAG: hypothetical protein AAF618_02620 [Pseudomonadota bacterium]